MQKKLIILFLPLFLLLAADKTDSLNNQLQLCQKSKDTKKEIGIIYELNAIYRNKGNFAKCDSLLKSGLNICLKNNYKNKYADLYRLVGINENQRGNLDSSIAAFQKSLFLHQALNDHEGVANQYENMGISYKDAARYEDAIRCQLQSLKIRQENGLKKKIAANLRNISVLYSRLKNPVKQEEYIRQALAVLQEDSAAKPTEYPCVYNEMALVFVNKEQPDSALVFYKMSYDYSKKIGWQTGISIALQNIGGIYANLNKYTKAQQYYREALTIAEKSNAPGDASSLYLEIAKCYADSSAKFLPQAIECAEKGYQLVKKRSYVDDEIKLTDFLSKHYAKAGRYQQAYEMQILSQTLKDSTLSNEHKKSVEELENKFQSEAKGRQIEKLNAENRFNRLTIRWGVAVFVLILLSVVLFINYLRKKNIMARNELEQKLLRSQMNPHFIFNALAAIQNFMLKNDPKKAAGYLGSFSALSRSVLTNSSKETVSLEEEIKMLKDYIELEKLRMQDSFDYQIIYDENEELDFIKIPPMMIQPFVENAIKHGLASIKSGGLLKLTIVCHENHITAEVTDNGVGMGNAQPESGKKHKSMAMSIFEKRRNLLESKYKKNLSFAINDLLTGNQTESGTKITITLPIIN